MAELSSAEYLAQVRAQQQDAQRFQLDLISLETEQAKHRAVATAMQKALDGIQG